MAKKKMGTAGAGDMRLVTTGKPPRKVKDEDPTEARSIRLPRSVLDVLDVAAAVSDERIGDFVATAITERVRRLEEKRGEPFPRKDAKR